MADAGGAEMPWENLSLEEQTLWESAAAAVITPPPGESEINARYAWSSGAPPPAAGQFESDSQNWNSATSLIFWPVDSSSLDLTSAFGGMVAGNTVRAQQASNTNNWRLWTLSGTPTVNADTTWTVPVTSSSSGGNQPSNGQACDLLFVV
jgi:hypothetical protein